MSDAWFDTKVAPDASIEDGCHPLEAQALKDYLRDNINTDEAARAITRPVEADNDPHSVLYRLWCLLIDAMMEAPAMQSKIIQLLLAVENLPSADSTDGDTNPSQQRKVVWRSLPGFGSLWSDLNKMDGWKLRWDNFSPEGKQEALDQYRQTAAIEARLFMSGVGAIPLTWGYRDICDALESSKAILDIDIHSAAKWLEIAGQRIRTQGTGEQEDFSALGRQRDLWNGGKSMSKERWAFWADRLRTVADDQNLREDTRDAAKEALKAMEVVEEPA
ncbi:MAG: hypothetical protein M1817_003927 [Caeruleum heppii]|nr:MAG: hypothetical protein M1817_003927 [Caeruleum heppii]